MFGRKKNAEKVEQKMETNMEPDINKVSWVVIGLNLDVAEFATPQEAEVEVVTKLLTESEAGTPVTIIKTIKVDADGKIRKRPEGEVVHRYNGGVSWIDDSLKGPAELQK